MSWRVLIVAPIVITLRVTNSWSYKGKSKINIKLKGYKDKKLESYEVTKLPNYQANKLPCYEVTKLTS